MRPVLNKLPVTRIADLTPLDPMRLPVFSVTTPLARDLTTHMGKGADALSAKVSALMEAVERISAESISAERQIHASYQELLNSKRHPLDPRSFDLPVESVYTPECRCQWVESFDLLNEQVVFLPVDLAINPPTEGLLQAVDSNGLAAGNTHLEAVVHGLNEVIERDVQSQLEFQALFADAQDPLIHCPVLKLDQLPAAAQNWVERLQQQDLTLTIYDASNDLGVATIRALISDFDYPSPQGPVTQHFIGWGSAPNSELALLRAITEAVQSRLGVLQSARDSFNTTRLGARFQTRVRRRQLLESQPRIEFSQVGSFDSDDLYEDLQFLLTRMRTAGFTQVTVTDLTRADIGIPVVRVRVPGLAQFSVNQRRVGWRCLRHLL